MTPDEERHRYLTAITGKGRWPIVNLLYQNPTGLFSGEVAKHLGNIYTHSRISHQLKILRDSGVVKIIRNKKNILYALNDSSRIKKILEI